ncbi:T6SS immunity protein Tli4 family protein [Erwinia aphidicola]|uniref:T6SS immunity protein Tli4 family protein n=1 Tax=Erwinia aphidicola TaxID=68334 RepID=A0ABU8DMK3_ERWAP
MKIFHYCVALSLACLISFTQAIAVPSPINDSAVINTLFAETKPQCIGRYIIDVPQSFNNQLHDMIFIDDFKISSKWIYPPAFQQRIRLREQELRDAINKPGNQAKDAPYLKEVIVLSDGRGVIYDHNEYGTPDIYRQLEAHVYVNHVAFVITAEFRDFSGEKNKQEKIDYLADGFSEADANTKPAKLAALQSLISRLSGRKDEEIPRGKGVCIPNGFIRDDGAKHIEKITFRYVNEDLSFGLYTNSEYLGSDDTLFNRSAQINEALKTSNKYSIKKMTLTPGGIPSEVWLFGGNQTITDPVTNEDEKNTFYRFMLNANERDATPEKPSINISLSSEYLKTQYSEAQMIEIWDRLVNSLRYK